MKYSASNFYLWPKEQCLYRGPKLSSLYTVKYTRNTRNGVLSPRLIESNTTLREGRENPIRVSKICNPRRGLPSRRCSKSWTRGWDSRVPPSMWCLIIFLILVQKCAKYYKRPRRDFSRLFGVDVLYVIGESLPEWACLTLQGGTTFLLTSKLADSPVSRVRK